MIVQPPKNTLYDEKTVMWAYHFHMAAIQSCCCQICRYVAKTAPSQNCLGYVWLCDVAVGYSPGESSHPTQIFHRLIGVPQVVYFGGVHEIRIAHNGAVFRQGIEQHHAETGPNFRQLGFQERPYET